MSELERYKPGHAPFEGAPLLEPEPEAAADDQPPEGWSGDSYFPKRRPGAEVWNENIEADNFSEEELCLVICRLAERDQRVGQFSLTVDELTEARKQSQKGMATVAQELAEDKAFPFSKIDLDAELGRYAVRHRHRDDGSDRRVLIVAEHLYRLTVANRQLRGRLREHEREALERSDSDTTR